MKMKQVELLNNYIADLAILNVKLHNLHWNVVGENFEQVHVYLEKLYDDLFIKFDEAAERVKMLGEFPVASVKQYLELTSVQELGTHEYQVKDALEVALNDYLSLKDKAVEIRKTADELDDFITVSLMEDHIAIFDKEIWFIKSALK
jgi:starvation-inducible DNA-binding protein